MGIPFLHFRDSNPLYYFSGEIEKKHGLMKIDYFRENFLINKNQFSHIDKNILLDMYAYIKNIEPFYKKNSLDISELSQNKFPLSSLRYSRSDLKDVKVAVVAHIYYEDLVFDIHETIKNIIEPFDIFVTTSNEASIKNIIDSFSLIANSVTIYLVNNRGRDIKPFIDLYKKGVLNSYKCVLKIHSKKSKYHLDGDLWRQELYNGLLKNSEHFLEIYNNFRTRKIGIIGIREFYLTHNQFWGANKSRASYLLSEIGSERSHHLEFFAGSMFWFNPKAFELINNLPDEMLAFEEESGLQDSTLAHVFERIFCNIARKGGYEIVASDNYKQLDPNERDYLKNNVPVL
jgi:rhamnosyltransferase